MNASVLTSAWVRRVVPRRPASSHKGNNGHILLVAGSRMMSGAAVLAGLGALRAGTGLLTIGIVENERRLITSRLPEAMVLPLPESRQGHLSSKALAILHRFSKEHRLQGVALGPGLSHSAGVKRVVSSILRTWKLPVILDADGLNVLKPKDIPRGVRLIITPHPGELARFLGVSRDAIQRDRVRMAAETARRLGMICVLKGQKTVISDGRRTFINPTGNSAMATGGMGDVLTGVVAAFVAQGLPLLEAAGAGVYVHGLAGNIMAKADRGLLAHEVADAIPQAIKKCLTA